MRFGSSPGVMTTKRVQSEPRARGVLRRVEVEMHPVTQGRIPDRKPKRLQCFNHLQGRIKRGSEQKDDQPSLSESVLLHRADRAPGQERRAPPIPKPKRKGQHLSELGAGQPSRPAVPRLRFCTTQLIPDDGRATSRVKPKPGLCQGCAEGSERCFCWE